MRVVLGVASAKLLFTKNAGDSSANATAIDILKLLTSETSLLDPPIMNFRKKIVIKLCVSTIHQCSAISFIFV